jgi:hypothetical protein
MDFIIKFMPEYISIKQVKEMKVQDILDMIEGKYKESENLTVEEKQLDLNKVKMKLKLMEHELKLN